MPNYYKVKKKVKKQRILSTIILYLTWWILLASMIITKISKIKSSVMLSFFINYVIKL
jgi:hypothetical protein